MSEQEVIQEIIKIETVEDVEFDEIYYIVHFRSNNKIRFKIYDTLEQARSIKAGQVLS